MRGGTGGQTGTRARFLVADRTASGAVTREVCVWLPIGRAANLPLDSGMPSRTVIRCTSMDPCIRTHRTGMGTSSGHPSMLAALPGVGGHPCVGPWWLSTPAQESYTFRARMPQHPFPRGIATRAANRPLTGSVRGIPRPTCVQCTPVFCVCLGMALGWSERPHT